MIPTNYHCFTYLTPSLIFIHFTLIIIPNQSNIIHFISLYSFHQLIHIYPPPIPLFFIFDFPQLNSPITIKNIIK